MKGLAAVAVLSCALVLACCVRVRPWERELLAKRCMSDKPSSLDVQYQDKLVEARTGSSRGGAAAGGGCGCTQ